MDFLSNIFKMWITPWKAGKKYRRVGGRISLFKTRFYSVVGMVLSAVWILYETGSPIFILLGTLIFLAFLLGFIYAERITRYWWGGDVQI